jgi:hypothetical protein
LRSAVSAGGAGKLEDGSTISVSMICGRFLFLLIRT